jgi:hypothetical protein
MQTVFYAFGSMIVLMLIISFLRLGLTLKGKFIIVFTSFVLALGGAATIASFPLWQTSLMLIVLIFFAAYFMDSRLGPVFYKENLSFEIGLEKDEVSEVMDEDISLLLERNTDDEVEVKVEESAVEVDYLSELESLLAVEKQVKTENMEDLIEETHELSSLNVQAAQSDNNDDVNEDSLDDPIFDFLLATKEVAVELEER